MAFWQSGEKSRVLCGMPRHLPAAEEPDVLMDPLRW
jgi:hypothetical protein